MPYLYGGFTCEYRHAYRSLPFLKGSEMNIEPESLLPWQTLGFPAFSGSAEYSVEFEIAESGEYSLDLGRVDDIADIFVDERHLTLLPWGPYKCHIGNMEKGVHSLRIVVANGPGNHDRLAMLNAGLLGPVKLFKQN